MEYDLKKYPFWVSELVGVETIAPFFYIVVSDPADLNRIKEMRGISNIEQIGYEKNKAKVYIDRLFRSEEVYSSVRHSLFHIYEDKF